MSDHGSVGSIPALCNNFSSPSTLLNTQFYELVCILLLLTKLSPACGWHLLPAVWAGWAQIKFMVDIITFGTTRDILWLVHPSYHLYSYQDKTKPARRLVRSLHDAPIKFLLVSWVSCLKSHYNIVITCVRSRAPKKEVPRTLDCTSLDMTAVQISRSAKFYFCDSVSNNKQYVIYGKRAHTKGGALGM